MNGERNPKKPKTDTPKRWVASRVLEIMLPPNLGEMSEFDTYISSQFVEKPPTRVVQKNSRESRGQTVTKMLKTGK